jgi:hypothetical protein
MEETTIAEADALVRKKPILVYWVLAAGLLGLCAFQASLLQQSLQWVDIQERVAAKWKAGYQADGVIEFLRGRGFEISESVASRDGKPLKAVQGLRSYSFTWPYHYEASVELLIDEDKILQSSSRIERLKAE